MGENGLKDWKCKNGHVLGVRQNIERERAIAPGMGGKAIRYHTARLMLYRRAVDPQAASPAEVDVIANVEGTTLDVRCDVEGCGAVRSWFEGAAALERLLDAQKERQG